MTPAPISVERLRELLATALDGVILDTSGCVLYPTETAHLSVSFLARHGTALLQQLADLKEWRFEVCERLGMSCAGGAEWTPSDVYSHVRHLEKLAAERAREVAIDRIITGLSEYGESVCRYEFGLPDYDEHIEAMRNIVRSALAANGGRDHG